MFGFIKKCFFTAVTFINFNLSGMNSLKCVSMNNQECQECQELMKQDT